jgi:hypothetical protein
MATALKPKAYPGVQLLAAASIEANSVEQALRGARKSGVLHQWLTNGFPTEKGV